MNSEKILKQGFNHLAVANLVRSKTPVYSGIGFVSLGNPTVKNCMDFSISSVNGNQINNLSFIYKC